MPTAGPRAGALFAEAARVLARPPYVVLVGLNILIYATIASFAGRADNAAGLTTLLLAVVSVYIQVALTLAAASGETKSADEWIKLGFARGVFWRTVLTSLLSVLLVMLGALFFIVGAFIVGSVVALAQPIAVLEREWPAKSLGRSAQLSREARVQLGVVYGVLAVAPVVLTELGAQTGLAERWGASWHIVGVATTIVSSAGVIALARAYIELGGTPAPAPEKRPDRRIAR
jgi:hypothetical protein